jgi:hypothetical protein
VFLVARFLMTYLLGKFRPTRLLFLMGALGVTFAVIAMFFLSIVGLIAIVAISLSLSLMFPTIYGVALKGLGEDTKFGAAGLVMAILGGALLTPVQGLLMDQIGTARAFVVVAVSLALVTAYALFDLRSDRGGGELVPAAGALTCRPLRCRVVCRRGASHSAWPPCSASSSPAAATTKAPVTVGLITKQETNPYWVTMREVAEDTAGEHDVELLTATGRTDVDVESQVRALEPWCGAGRRGSSSPPPTRRPSCRRSSRRAARESPSSPSTPRRSPSRPSTPCSPRTTGGPVR